MDKSYLSPIGQWWAEFEENPLEALDGLLFEWTYMGWLNSHETDEILFHLFGKKSIKIRGHLDEVMTQWFESYWQKSPDSVSAEGWAGILQNSFIAVYRLNLEGSVGFLREIYLTDKSWIRSLYQGPSRDPEGELLRTLALCQKDQKLLPLWMSLCRWEEDIPVDYTAIGLLGLRKLPEKNGKAPGDIPKAFFKGAVTLAEAMAEKKKPEYRDEWIRGMRAITALYPRFKRYWAEHFSPFLFYRPDSAPAQWLDKVVPKLSAQFKRKSDLFLEPPPYEKRTFFLKQIEIRPLNEFRNELDLFLERHRAYAYQTGDSSILVGTFSNIGFKIYRQDAAYALSLVEEAFDWEPYNAFLWSERAKIEAFRGNVSRAEGLLWEAKRRFPEDPQVRSQLAELLVKSDKHKQAETLYRETMADFPDNVVCRAGLAEVLKSQERFEEAGKIYRETMADFPDNVVCRNGLAVVLVKRGKKAEAIVLLKETLEKSPGDKTATEFLEKITGGKDISEEDEKKLETGEYDLSRWMEPLPVVAEDTVKYGTEAKEEKNVINLIETEIGKIILERRLRDFMKKEEKERVKKETSEALENVLKKAPGYIPALLVRGFHMADENPEQAEAFFAGQADTHPNTAGFHLMGLRVKGILNKEIGNEEWNGLTRHFPGKVTVVKLEHTLHEMNKGNGSRIKQLEQLRKQIVKKNGRLPASLRQKEEWVKGAVKHNLFKDIDIDNPIDKESFPTIEENFRRDESTLLHTVEQCICAAV